MCMIQLLEASLATRKLAPPCAHTKPMYDMYYTHTTFIKYTYNAHIEHTHSSSNTHSTLSIRSYKCPCVWDVRYVSVDKCSPIFSLTSHMSLAGSIWTNYYYYQSLYLYYSANFDGIANIYYFFTRNFLSSKMTKFL